MKSVMELALLLPDSVRISDAIPSTLGVCADRTIIRRERVNKQLGTPVIHL